MHKANLRHYGPTVAERTIESESLRYEGQPYALFASLRKPWQSAQP